jgi:hypothetical protein
MRPTDLPLTDHFQRLACGVRAKYVAGGCRCLQCRAANSRYETARAAARQRGEWNGLVPADRARAHMVTLSRAGVGRRAVGAASDVGDTTLSEIRNGTKTQIRADTERRILAVDASCVSDHALVSARRAQRLLGRLKAEGYPARRLVRWLGGTSQGLQFGTRRMTARNVRRIEQLYRELMAVS